MKLYSNQYMWQEFDSISIWVKVVFTKLLLVSDLLSHIMGSPYEYIVVYIDNLAIATKDLKEITDALMKT